jgi:hypothetical protein
MPRKPEDVSSDISKGDHLHKSRIADSIIDKNRYYHKTSRKKLDPLLVIP